MVWKIFSNNQENEKKKIEEKEINSQEIIENSESVEESTLDEDKKEKSQDKHDHSSKQDHLLGVIFDALLQNIHFEVSPLLVEEERKNALSRLVNQLTSLKLTVADYLKSIKIDWFKFTSTGCRVSKM